MAESDDIAAAYYGDPANQVAAGPGKRVRRRNGGLSAYVPVRFDARLIAAVKSIAARDGVTVSTWIRNAVKREVERRLPVGAVTSGTTGSFVVQWPAPFTVTGPTYDPARTAITLVEETQ